MLPYGIVIKQNKNTFYQSLMLWQKKYGILKLSSLALHFAVVGVIFGLVSAAYFAFFKQRVTIYDAAAVFGMGLILIAYFLYSSAVKTVRDFSGNFDKRLQLVLKEDIIEITTENSKQTVPYDEICLCFEKNFLLTIITDKYSLPISVSKMMLEKGNYDIFVSLIKEKLADRYVKKGEY